MTAAKWKRVKRYSDGLIDPTWRLTCRDKGVTWVTDRFVMVRADMFTRPVTPRCDVGPFTTLPVSRLRQVLARASRTGTWARLVGRTADSVGAVLVYAGVASAAPFDSRIEPLIEACDFVRLRDGVLCGFQKRPHCAEPVLVFLAYAKRWNADYLADGSAA